MSVLPNNRRIAENFGARLCANLNRQATTFQKGANAIVAGLVLFGAFGTSPVAAAIIIERDQLVTPIIVVPVGNWALARNAYRSHVWANQYGTVSLHTFGSTALPGSARVALHLNRAHAFRQGRY